MPKKPMTDYIPGDGYITYDLTEGKVHRLTNEDGTTRVVIRFPKTWIKATEPHTLSVVGGHSMTMYAYTVTEWGEIEIKTA